MSNRVIIYARLSREDEDKIDGNTESRSIENQINILSEYAVKNNFQIVDIIFDDGFSGSNQNRPGIQRVKDLAKSKSFDILLIKDISRLGRSLYQVADLIDTFFPANKIRVIAVSDNYDSLTYNDDLGIVIRNFLNDYYLKDFKKKINKSLDYRGKTKKLSSFPKYGYLYDNEQNVVVDPYASKIVYRIFEQYISGVSNVDIAKGLNDEGIPNRSYYIMSITGKDRKYTNAKSNKWSSETITSVIKDYEYCGHAVNFAYSKRDKVIIKNILPAIITEEMYQNATKIRKGRHQQHRGVNHLGKILYDKYNKHAAYSLCEKEPKYTFREACFLVDASLINKVVYDDVIATIEKCRQDPEAFRRIYKEKLIEHFKSDVDIENRLKELNKDYTKLFDSFIKGKIDEELFEQKVEKINIETKELETKLRNSKTIDAKLTIYDRKFEAFLKDYNATYDDSIDLIKALVSRVDIRWIGGTRKHKKLSINITYKFEEI